MGIEKTQLPEIQFNGEPEPPERANIAYVDAANLDKSMKLQLQWELDYKKFRIWLREKYDVQKAYIFVGLIPRYRDLYVYLQESGFTLVFKEVVYRPGAVPKGNCDADLIQQANNDYYGQKLQRAVLVASDGDYAPLVQHLFDNGQIETILSPALPAKCSILLKRIGAPIAYIKDQRSLLEKKTDGTK